MRATSGCVCEGVSEERSPTLNVTGTTPQAGVFSWMENGKEEAGLPFGVCMNKQPYSPP